MRGRRQVLLVDGFHELADDERYALDALDLLLGPYQLALQTPTSIVSIFVQLEALSPNIPLLILDILFLQLDVPIKVSVRHSITRPHITQQKHTLVVSEASSSSHNRHLRPLTRPQSYQSSGWQSARLVCEAARCWPGFRQQRRPFWLWEGEYGN